MSPLEIDRKSNHDNKQRAAIATTASKTNKKAPIVQTVPHTKSRMSEHLLILELSFYNVSDFKVKLYIVPENFANF